MNLHKSSEVFDNVRTPKGKEKMGQPVTFHVAEHGLETSVDEVLSDRDFQGRDPKEFKLNRSWHTVTVASGADKDRWVKLRNEYLTCAWTLNQSAEECKKNGDRMREIEKEMLELENKA